jgi:hypothetical protein
MFSKLPAAFALVFLSACGASKDDTNVPDVDRIFDDAPKQSLTTLKTNFWATTQEEAVGRIKAMFGIGAALAENCRDTAINVKPISEVGVRYQISKRVADFTDCWKSLDSNVMAVKLTGWSGVTCAMGELKGKVGDPLEECPVIFSSSELHFTEVETKARYTDEAGGYPFTLKTTTFSGNTTGGPCTWTSNPDRSESLNCAHKVTSVMVSEEPGGIVTMKNEIVSTEEWTDMTRTVIGDVDSFKSSFRLNNWSGTVKISSWETGLSWTISDGTNSFDGNAPLP